MTERVEFTGTYSVIIVLEQGPIIIESQDIASFYFVESIYNYCLTGKLVFQDMYGLQEHGPLTGNEQIILSYGVDEDRQLAFDIWKIGKVSQLSVTDPTASSMLEIHFVDIFYELYTLKRYSRSFGGEWKTSDIVQHILRNMMQYDSKNIDIEESSSVITDFVMPYWTPMQAISWLSSRGRGNESGVGGYVCHTSTRNGKSNAVYKTMNMLLGERNYIEEELYTFEGFRNDRNKILEWSVSGLDKTATKVLRGGKWHGFDSATKAPVTLEYAYSDGVSDTMMMGRKSLFTDISDTTTSNVLTGEDNEEIVKNIAYDAWSRRYNIQQVVSIIVRGHEDRYCGQQIEIVWPSTEKEQRDNKLLKGKYLIKSITNMLAGTGNNITYQQRLMLIKNAYSDADMKSLVKASQKNVY